MPYRTLQLGHDGPVTTLTLNRPEKRNALSSEMMVELHAALDEAESGPERVLILTGAGKAFCAGMDLGGLREMASVSATSEASHEGARAIAALFRRLYAYPKPLIAAVNGHAVAGGCGIAMLCDFTLAAPEARLGFTEVRVGFMPAFIAVFLTRQIGEKRARDLLLSGRLLGAEEGKELGLINEVIPVGKLFERAREIARALCDVSPTSLRFTKRLIRDLAQPQLDRDLELAIEASAEIRSTADFREGLSAFLAKRPARWSGP
ncbi:MAG: enoyl-CoA hydratase/isomerase family protein [Terriglobia bacterium]